MRGTAAEVLTPTGAIVPVTASVDDAERRLVTLGAAELYVLDPDGQLAGVLPDYDLLKRRLGGDGRTPCVGELMSRVDIRASCATPLRELAMHMRLSNRARIPVVANGRLIGEVTRTSVLRQLRKSEACAADAASEPVQVQEKRTAPPGGPKFLRSGSVMGPAPEASLLGGIAITE
jgi:CBS domain-containing protein